MFRFIFNKIVTMINFLGRETGLPLEIIEFNIWFVIIPFSWCTLLDVIFGTPLIELTFLGVLGLLLSVVNHDTFFDTVSEKIVNFSRYFNRWGIDHVAILVILFIIVPLIIYSLFIYYLFT